MPFVDACNKDYMLLYVAGSTDPTGYIHAGRGNTSEQLDFLAHKVLMTSHAQNQI